MRYLTAPQDREHVEGVLMEDLSKNVGCSSVTFPVYTTYSQVCGIARGYQYGIMDALQEVTGETIDQIYVDGLSITRGIPRQHLWTLAVGWSEDYYNLMVRCPRDQDPFNFDNVPDFVSTIFTVNPDSLLP